MSSSFDGDSNSTLAGVAADRPVVEEFSGEGHSADGFHDEFNFERDLDFQSVKIELGDDGIEEFGFEFEFLTKDSESSSISADEIFQNGKIRAIYPVSNRDPVIGRGNVDGGTADEKGRKTIRLPLMKLFIEERETEAASSSASSEADELDGVPDEMYCVWQPKSPGPSDKPTEVVPEELYCVWRPKPAVAKVEVEGRCPKSSSTGSVYKKWKLKDLLPRSHSEGRKEGGGFPALSGGGRSGDTAEKVKERAVVARKLKLVAPPHPLMYKRDGGGERRRTYLPYRPVGFFSNVGFQ